MQQTNEDEAPLIFLNGKGIYIWSDGTSYNGDWRNNGRFGYGVYEWPEGSKYEGFWEND